MTSISPTRTTQALALVKTAVFFAIVPSTVAGYFPYWLLGAPSIPPVAEFGLPQWAGAALFVLGAAGLLWCGWNFAVVGLGTPAPFDAPKRLVVRGPYRWVRNPMYVAVGTALIGESLFFRTTLLLPYLGFFGLILHLFVLLYEEPTLREKFGPDYEAYCRQVWRWIPLPPRKPT